MAKLQERALASRGLGNRRGEGGPIVIWTAPRIIAALGQLAVAVGHPPTIADLESRPRALWPSPTRVRTVFGSWQAALAAAGLRPQMADHSPRRVWSDEEILQAIQDAAAAGDPGERPFREGRRRPRLKTITERFGSWPVAESLALGADRSEAEPRDVDAHDARRPRDAAGAAGDPRLTSRRGRAPAPKPPPRRTPGLT